MLKSLLQQAFQLLVLLLECNVSSVGLRQQAVECIEILAQLLVDVLHLTLDDISLVIHPFNLFQVVESVVDRGLWSLTIGRRCAMFGRRRTIFGRSWARCSDFQ